MLTNKTILVTGGTGSFGQKFTELALKHDPKAIRIFSRGEYLQWDMSRKFSDERLRFFIGDVRDRDRIYRATTGVDIVVHAAALKQVPTAEYNPFECVQTNVVGTMNVIDAAIDREVERMITISSDKAAQPLNLYGASKLVAEKLTIQANSYSTEIKCAGFDVTDKRPKFSCVRYGNVAFSRGSVVPLWLEQRKSGHIDITDGRMTRFWLTLEQGVNFAIDSIDRMEGGEIFVPKIPSVMIMSLAGAVAPEAEKIITGIRPGEKLHETLITEDEVRHTKEFDDYFLIEPEHPFWKMKPANGRMMIMPYSSDSNSWWLSKEELQELIRAE